MSKGFILGCDPGLRGALALIDRKTAEMIDICDMPIRHLMPRRVRKGAPRRDAKGKAIPLKQDSRQVFDANALSEWLRPYAPDIQVAAIENVSSRSGQGVKSVFSLGGAFWALKAVLECNGINYGLLPPKTWQEHYGLVFKAGMSSDERKELISESCQQYYDRSILLGPQGGLKDGRSDSLMISRYLFEVGPAAGFVAQPPFGPVFQTEDLSA